MSNHRLTRSAALGLALAALAAPTASRQIRDETVVGTQQSPPATAQIRDETIVRASQRPTAPAHTAGQIRDETVVGTQQSPPVTAQIRDETVVQAPPAAGSPPADGIDSGEAAIAGLGLLAVITLGLGGAFAVSRHRRDRPQPMRNLTATGVDRR